MQKRIISLLLCFILSLALLVGCGGNQNADNDTTLDSQGMQTESNFESESDSEFVSDSENEDKTETEVDPETKVDTESERNSETESSFVPATETQQPEPEPTESEPTDSEPQYTYKELNKTMYVKSGVNVRDLPSSDGEKLGKLSEGEAVTVTGQCNETKWYRIVYKNQIGYVSNSYLTDSKPSVPESESESETESESTSEPDNSGNSVDYSLEYEAIKTPTVPNTDNLFTAQEIVNVIITSDMKSDFDKVFAIHNWLIFNIDYDHNYKNYYTEETLRDRVGVCQGYAYAFREMCTLVGIETTIVGGTGTTSDGSIESHAWNQVKIDGVWYNVDVTWDDPSNGPTKNPNDHSGNRYDYFLVSNSTLYKNHQASQVVEGNAINTCSKDYKRQDILRKAVETGLYGDVAFAETTNEIDAAVIKYMKGDKSEFWLWYYDTTITKDNLESKIRAELAKLSYPANVSGYIEPSSGVTKFRIVITPVSKWNSISVVTNVDEFLAEVRKQTDDGKMSFYIRYETNVAPEIDSERGYGFSYYEIKYRNGKSCLYEIWPL